MVLSESRIFIYFISQSSAIILKYNLLTRNRVSHLFPSFLQQVFIAIQISDRKLFRVILTIHSTITAHTINLWQATTRILTSQTSVFYVVFGIHVFISLTGKVQTTLKFIRNLGNSFFSFLCLHQNDTIIGTSTINSSRSCIFQYLDWLDIRRIDIIHRANNSVYYHQRTSGRFNTGTTTQHNSRRTTRSTGCIRHPQTTDRTLQCLCRISNRCILKYFTIHFRNSRGHSGTFLLHTISHNDHFIQYFSIFFQHHLVMALRAHHNLLWFVTKKTHFQFCTFRNLESKVTIYISYCTICCAHFQNTCSDNRFSDSIYHRSRYRLCLC